MEILGFNVNFHIEDFLDWLSEVEKFFDVMEVSKHRKGKLVVIRMKGRVVA